VYGQRQAGRIWNKYLVNILTNKLHFKQSKYDVCIFYRGSTIYLLYTDDSILAGPNQTEIKNIIQELKNSNLELTILGDIKDFLGVHVSREDDSRVYISQPHLIDQIIEDTYQTHAKSRPTSAKASTILHRYQSSDACRPKFNYKSIIGKLNYLEWGTRSDISYATYQCAWFCAAPKCPYVDVVRWLVRYLIGTWTKGYYTNP